MGQHKRLAIVLASAMAFLGTEAVRAGVPDRVLTVRVYNNGGLPPAEVVAAAETTAGPLLSSTGIQVFFRFCGMPVPCDGRLGPGDVIVRIIRAPAGVSDRAYGVAHVLPPDDRGWLASVFADRIAAGAERAGLAPRQLLGLVMAHEVGHLLLGEAHSPTGLMSARWHDTVLRRDGAAADAPVWRFTADQASVMQERLNER
jgi:hypothetical protein